MTKQELLDREVDAWGALKRALGEVDPARRTVEGVVPGWSSHDLAWHTAYWADWAADAIERIHDGRPAREEPEDDDAWVAEILAAGRTMSWEDALARLSEGRERARVALQAFEGEIPDGAVQWFTEDAIDHYLEHAAEVSAFLAGP